VAASTSEQARSGDGAVGMWVFLVADAISFIALFIAWGVLRVRAESGAAWPTGRLDLGLGAALTYVLLGSSLAMSLAGGAAAAGRTRAAAGWLWLTIVLGAAFLAGQAGEWHALAGRGIVPASDAQAATFYVCTGWHGAHVLAGLVALVACAFARARASTLAVAALFWHFVDAVWIVLFTLVYLA
jgi:heme/copper-type cytochrome/quinol oxidase subunit 3